MKKETKKKIVYLVCKLLKYNELINYKLVQKEKGYDYFPLRRCFTYVISKWDDTIDGDTLAAKTESSKKEVINNLVDKFIKPSLNVKYSENGEVSFLTCKVGFVDYIGCKKKGVFLNALEESKKKFIVNEITINDEVFYNIVDENNKYVCEEPISLFKDIIEATKECDRLRENFINLKVSEV